MNSNVVRIGKNKLCMLGGSASSTLFRTNCAYDEAPKWVDDAAKRTFVLASLRSFSCHSSSTSSASSVRLTTHNPWKHWIRIFCIHISKSLDEPEPSLDIAKSFDGYEPQSISTSDFYQPFAAMVIRRPTSLDLLLLLDLGPFTPKISPQAPKPPNPPNQIIYTFKSLLWKP